MAEGNGSLGLGLGRRPRGLRAGRGSGVAGHRTEGGCGQNEAGRTAGGSQGPAPGRPLSGPAGIRSTNGRTPGPYSGSITRDSWRHPGTGARGPGVAAAGGTGTGPGGRMWGSQVQDEEGGVHEVTMHC